MAEGSTIAIASLAVATGGLAISLVIAYIKEKTDTSKRNGELGRDVKSCASAIEKLEGVPRQMTALEGQIKNLDNRLNDLPEKVAKVDKRIQFFEDVCPAFHQHAAGGCEAGDSKEKKPCST